MKRINIFRAGVHIDSAGQKLEFTQADLAALAQHYNPLISEAPIVVGHPATNDPAYGWVESLVVSKGELYANPRQVDPQFEEMVDSGRFKKVSVSLYTPDHPGNPMPGAYYLRHVGFLGATPPAVKGLRTPIAFATTVGRTVEFSTYADRTNAGLWRSFKNWLLTEKGADVAENVVPEWQVNALQEESLREALQPTAAKNDYQEPQDFHQGMAEEFGRYLAGKPNNQETAVTDIEKLQAELAAQKTQNERLQAELKQQALTNARKSASDFVEARVKEGKVLPADAPFVQALLVGLPDAVVEFGEGDTKTVQTLRAGFESLLKRFPAQVTFGEVATGPVPSGPSEDPQVIGQQARDFVEQAAKQGRTVSIADAVNHVMNQGVK